MLYRKHNAPIQSDDGSDMVNVPITEWFDKMAQAELMDWFEGIGVITSAAYQTLVRRVGKVASEAWHAQSDSQT